MAPKTNTKKTSKDKKALKRKKTEESSDVTSEESDSDIHSVNTITKTVPSSTIPTSNPTATSSATKNIPNSTATSSATKNIPKFLLITSTDKDRSVVNLSPFIIGKALEGLAGAPKSIKKLWSSGQLLVEVTRDSHATNLLRSMVLAGVPITVTPHGALNSSKGVVRSRDFAGVSDQDMLEGLQLDGVCATDVKRITIRKGEARIATGTFIITFGCPVLPTEIIAAYQKINVEPYIPNPLRCFKCQRFGHHQDRCKREARCGRCGEEGHVDSSCSSDHKCCNCSGNHTSYARACPVWKAEKEIVHIKVTRRVSFPDARKIVEARTPTTGQSYANATRVVRSASSTSEIACQTDISWLRGDNYKTLNPPSTNNKILTPRSTKSNAITATTQTSSTSLSESSIQNISHLPKEKVTPEKIQSSSTTKQVNKDRMRGSRHLTSDRPAKGSDDAIQVFNRYGQLDDMDASDVSIPHSRRNSVSPRKHSPVRHPKPPNG